MTLNPILLALGKALAQLIAMLAFGAVGLGLGVIVTHGPIWVGVSVVLAIAFIVLFVVNLLL
jgi:hypothetical protein